MSRYIDADKIEEVIRNDVPLKYFMTSSYNVAIQNGLKIAQILNDKIPTVDVVEVVRCKDCPYFRPYTRVVDFDGRCRAHARETDKTEFCSIGCKTKGKSMQELLNEIY